MFTLSKIFFFLVKPSDLLLLALLLGLALLWGRGERARRWGYGILTTIAVASLLIYVTPIPVLVLGPLENRFPVPKTLPSHIDGIVVLGGAIDGDVSLKRAQVTLSENGTRLTNAVELARLHPEARILFTGGSGDLLHPKELEAPLAGRFLENMGIDPARIVLESHSRNTYENALFSRLLVRPKPGEHWVLITSAAHMPRSVGIFRALGWQVIPYPVAFRTTGRYSLLEFTDFPNSLLDLDFAAKEWLGLIAYRALGRTDALFPGPEPPSSP